LQPYRQLSVACLLASMALSRFFKRWVQWRIVWIYRWDHSSTLFFMFLSRRSSWVGLLKQFSQLPPVNDHGVIQPEPEQILDCRSRGVHDHAVEELLVR
jgi:hypothetical protein